MPLSGVLPAAITPFTSEGDIDYASFAKLAAYFTAAGCNGVVVAGTNGEGPSLSAVEKRDLCRRAVTLASPLPVVLGISTPSLHEATWLASQAGKAGAHSVLLMPPGYFRPAPTEGVLAFLESVADAATCPVIVYNHPALTGFTLLPDHVSRLARHPNVCGFKDSSGDPQNLPAYRAAAPDADLFVGNETLLQQAVRSGWSGTVSGVANILPQWLVSVTNDLRADPENDTRFKLVLPVIEHLRAQPQPPTNKAVLAEWRVVENPDPRLPLQPADPTKTLALVKDTLGISAENLALP